MQQLISKIYDCAMQPRLWPDVLQDIASAAGAFGAVIFDCETQNGHNSVHLRRLSSIYDPEIVTRDATAQNALRDQAGFATFSSHRDGVNLRRCDDLFSGRAELDQQPTTQSMLQTGLCDRAGALLCKDTVSLDRFALQFHRAQGAIAEDKALQIRGILPHLTKALSIGRALGAVQKQNLALIQSLERLPFGVAILRPNGDLIFNNPTFLALAERYRLLANGKITVDLLPNSMRRLFQGTQEHAKCGAGPQRAAGFLQGRLNDIGLFIEVRRVAAHPEFEHFGAGTYLVSLLDSHNDHLIDAGVLRSFFPVTEAEVTVLDLVVKGHTNAEIAEIRNRSLETINSQLKALIQKSGTRNRTELVRMAVSLSVASLGRG